MIILSGVHSWMKILVEANKGLGSPLLLLILEGILTPSTLPSERLWFYVY